MLEELIKNLKQEESPSGWEEIDERVFCKVDPFTMQAIVMKMERKGLVKSYTRRKRYEKILRSLSTRYEVTYLEDTELDTCEEKEVTSTNESKEEVASRLALGLIRIKCNMRKRNLRMLKRVISAFEEENPDEELRRKMARNRWQVAVGMVMGMAKMAYVSILDENEPFSVGDLSFNVNFFRANKDTVVLTADTKFILSQLPDKRTKEQIDDVIKNLSQMAIKSFNEYPKRIQEKIIKIARYEVVTPQRVIVRQGYPSENLYFLINGVVQMTKRIRNLRKDRDYEKTNILQKGASFGELEMVNRIPRSATAISNTDVQLLTIERGELHSVLTKRIAKTELPEHVKFLKECKFTDLWPIERLANNLDQCAPYFFKHNTVMVEDIEKTDWIFVIRSGLCRVLRKLWKPSLKNPKRCELTGNYPKSKGEETTAALFRRRFAIYHTLDSRTNRIFGEKGQSRKLFRQMKEKASSTSVSDDSVLPKSADASDTKQPKLNRFRKSKFYEKKGSLNDQIRRKEMSVIQKKSAKQNEDKDRLEQAFLAIGSQDERYNYKYDNLGSGDGEELVYIQIDTLKPHDAFGLETVVFDKYYDHPCCPGLCLASGGDEKGVHVVLLSKTFFVEHASEQVAWKVRKIARSYPTASVLEEEIQRRRLWNIYKKDLMAEVLANKTRKSKDRW